MSNSKGNNFPLWGVNNAYQVFAVDNSGAVKTMSKENFAFSVSVSADGTVWALSTTPDPDGGGAKIFWSNGDDQWNEINTPDPGALRIAGAEGDTCLYLTYDGEVRLLDTNSNNKVYYKNQSLIDFDYGEGMIWGIFPEKPGDIPTLHYSDYNNLNWKEFAGNISPYSISVGYAGDCYGIQDLSPKYYSKDGQSTGSAGAGLDGKSLQISFKNWSYVLSTDANLDGNLVYEWVDTQGGVFQATAVRGISIAASYHVKS
jgi:predicted heme/steroid binding protein